jgi:hypothetical protein
VCKDLLLMIYPTPGLCRREWPVASFLVTGSMGCSKRRAMTKLGEQMIGFYAVRWRERFLTQVAVGGAFTDKLGTLRIVTTIKELFLLLQLCGPVGGRGGTPRGGR